ncbi:hypothetical protein DFH09DRAFT_1288326 [Mycena vulgaris]|nr:hypothetical protein DFH09DRAFT_1288326 [Mycena vulgaris]
MSPCHKIVDCRGSSSVSGDFRCSTDDCQKRKVMSKLARLTNPADTGGHSMAVSASPQQPTLWSMANSVLTLPPMSSKSTFPIVTPDTPLAFLDRRTGLLFVASSYLYIATLSAYIWELFSSVPEEVKIIRDTRLSLPIFAYFLSRVQFVSTVHASHMCDVTGSFLSRTPVLMCTQRDTTWLGTGQRGGTGGREGEGEGGQGGRGKKRKGRGRRGKSGCAWVAWGTWGCAGVHTVFVIEHEPKRGQRRHCYGYQVTSKSANHGKKARNSWTFREDTAGRAMRRQMALENWMGARDCVSKADFDFASAPVHSWDLAFTSVHNLVAQPSEGWHTCLQDYTRRALVFISIFGSQCTMCLAHTHVHFHSPCGSILCSQDLSSLSLKSSGGLDRLELKMS